MAVLCPGHESLAKDDSPWWCEDCLSQKVWEARASLDPCRCSEFPGEHWHG